VGAVFHKISSGGEGVRAGCRSRSPEVYGNASPDGRIRTGQVEPDAGDGVSAVVSGSAVVAPPRLAAPAMARGRLFIRTASRPYRSLVSGSPACLAEAHRRRAKEWLTQPGLADRGPVVRGAVAGYRPDAREPAGVRLRGGGDAPRAEKVAIGLCVTNAIVDAARPCSRVSGSIRRLDERGPMHRQVRSGGAERMNAGLVCGQQAQARQRGEAR
jgi:hypothetical protein